MVRLGFRHEKWYTSQVQRIITKLILYLSLLKCIGSSPTTAQHLPGWYLGYIGPYHGLQGSWIVGLGVSLTPSHHLHPTTTGNLSFQIFILHHVFEEVKMCVCLTTIHHLTMTNFHYSWHSREAVVGVVDPSTNSIYLHYPCYHYHHSPQHSTTTITPLPYTCVHCLCYCKQVFITV